MRGGRSRNKVAVGEPAAGSPPIYLNLNYLEFAIRVIN